MGAMAASEAAAGREPGGPQGPGVGAEWLILQRLSDIKEQLGDLRRGLDDLRRELDDLRRELDVKVDGLRTWSLGLLLLAILGLLAKLLIPGA